MGRRRNPVNLKSNTMISKTKTRNYHLIIVNKPNSPFFEA